MGYSLGHHSRRTVSDYKIDFPEPTLISTTTVSSTTNPGHTEKTDNPGYSDENRAIIQLSQISMLLFLSLLFLFY